MWTLLRLLLHESRGAVALAIASGALGGIGGVALIVLIQQSLRGDTAPSLSSCWTFAAVCVFATAARVVAQATMIRLGQGAVARLSLRLCRSILALPQEKFEEADPSALTAVLMGDIGVIVNALVGIPEICINVPVVLACFAYIGWLSPVVFVCGVAFTAVALVVYLGLSAKAVELLQTARADQDRVVGYFRAVIEGFRELKLHRPRREAFQNIGLAGAVASVRQRTSSGMTIFAAAEGWSHLAFFGFMGLIVFALPRFQAIDRGTLAGVALVVLYIMGPLDSLVSWMPTLGRARVSVLRIQRLIPSLEASAATDPAPLPMSLRDSVRLEGVCYTYQGEPDGGEGFALGPVDLTLRPGEIVFLAGGNGSGKTTLVKLLTGLYVPHAGTISLDDATLGPDDIEGYRQLFSVVFADGFLFQELMGIESDRLDERARLGLARLGLGGRVRFAGGAYSSIDLSQGQRRRLALLTALLEDRPVYIFDEWAANQDVHFKKYYYCELLPELRERGKAVLVISHDEAYYGTADRTVRLHDGQLVEAVGEAVVGNGVTS